MVAYIHGFLSTSSSMNLVTLRKVEKHFLDLINAKWMTHPKWSCAVWVEWFLHILLRVVIHTCTSKTANLVVASKGVLLSVFWISKKLSMVYTVDRELFEFDVGFRLESYVITYIAIFLTQQHLFVKAVIPNIFLVKILLLFFSVRERQTVLDVLLTPDSETSGSKCSSNFINFNFLIPCGTPFLDIFL